eukprot:576486-Rhodomonas_salina.1
MLGVTCTWMVIPAILQRALDPPQLAEVQQPQSAEDPEKILNSFEVVVCKLAVGHIYGQRQLPVALSVLVATQFDTRATKFTCSASSASKRCVTIILPDPNDRQTRFATHTRSV